MTKLERLEKVKARHKEMLSFDNSYNKTIIGMDEVGRGPLFGPVVTCACNINPCEELIEVYDSKSLSEKKREHLFDIIIENANSYGIGISSAKMIDDLGIQRATSLAMKQALDSLKDVDINNSLILVDYITFEIEAYTYEALKKGDTKSFQIACASILAKVTRDRMIKEMDAKFPEYDLKNNKGYGSKKHREALQTFGASSEHRQTFLTRILSNEVSK